MANFASESAKSSTASISISTAAEPATSSTGVTVGCSTASSPSGAPPESQTTTSSPPPFRRGRPPRTTSRCSPVDRRSNGRRRTLPLGRDRHAGDRDRRHHPHRRVRRRPRTVPAAPGAFPKMMQVKQGQAPRRLAGRWHRGRPPGAATAAYHFALGAPAKAPPSPTPASRSAPCRSNRSCRAATTRGLHDRHAVAHPASSSLDMLGSAAPRQGRRRSSMARAWPRAWSLRTPSPSGPLPLRRAAPPTRPTAASFARMLRDLSMGLVQAFPVEKGRMEVADDALVRGTGSTQFALVAAETQVSVGPPSVHQLQVDLAAIGGVWRDRLRATGPDGVELHHDDAGGVPGAFPYENLVYVDSPRRCRHPDQRRAVGSCAPRAQIHRHRRGRGPASAPPRPRGTRTPRGVRRCRADLVCRRIDHPRGRRPLRRARPDPHRGRPSLA